MRLLLDPVAKAAADVHVFETTGRTPLCLVCWCCCRRFFSQLISAVDYCQQQGLELREIRPCGVLFQVGYCGSPQCCHLFQPLAVATMAGLAGQLTEWLRWCKGPPAHQVQATRRV